MTARFLCSSDEDFVEAVLALHDLRSQKSVLEKAHTPKFSKIAAIDKRIEKLVNYIKKAYTF